jgi:UrcA family protein
MRNRGFEIGLFFAAVGATGAAGATAATSSSTAQKSVVVHYSQDDLASNSGAAHLYSMLDRAARYVCDDTGHYIDLMVQADVGRCVQTAIANAVSTVSSASLTSVYNRHFRNQPLVEKERLSERTRSSVVAVAG